jgi:CheY-like chemotaxis protein
MASGIVHDFNNILMPIMGFSDFLVKNPKLLDNKEDVIQILKDIHAASQDAKRTVMRLREFYKPTETGQRCVIPVIQILKGALSLTQPRWKDEMEAKGIKIKIVEEYNASPSVFVEESAMREVIVNILLNSLDAMPNGGTITLRTYIDSNRAVIQISDTGIGMTPETLRRCFEPFYTTKGIHGTGMGLSLAYVTIRRYGGTIEAASELGKGTTMTIRLPLAEMQHPSQIAYARTILKPPKQILVIDDEIWSRDMLLAFLTNDGHSVDTAASGHEGLRKFETKNYDVVIVDRAMPDMNGDDVASIIKSKNPNVPVIFATGFGDMMKESGEKPPCVDYILSKPATLDELREALCAVFKVS